MSEKFQLKFIPTDVLFMIVLLSEPFVLFLHSGVEHILEFIQRAELGNSQSNFRVQCLAKL